jgi:sugar phosphate isomerase/epimerase
VITYCTNIHPGESWGDTFQNLRTHIPPIKAAVSPNKSFPLGLRLSALAAQELEESNIAVFTEWLQQHDLYLPTINGFPYGAFHAVHIKENVYLPDWRHSERVEYSKRLAMLLDVWLPSDICGSVSTVPIGFKSCINASDIDQVRTNLTFVLEYLAQLRQSSGKKILLALEAEPGCLLETVADIIDFFTHMNFSAELQEGLGVCFDCCHHAVEFENPGTAIKHLAEAGITIAKAQISSAPRMFDPARAELERLCEDTYLHQVVIRDTAGFFTRYNDLPFAMREHNFKNGDEWRVHFHLPIFLQHTPWCATTQNFIEEALPLLDSRTLLEIETYTWNVLPPELQAATVTKSIINEIAWLKAKRL